MNEKNIKEMLCLLYYTVQAAFVLRITGDYFGRAVAVRPPNVENVSFIFCAFLSSLGSHILCPTETRKLYFSNCGPLGY